jgi:hypothetical protein
MAWTSPSYGMKFENNGKSPPLYSEGSPTLAAGHRAMAGPSGQRDSSDILKILVASDMHLGYGERDPIRGEDSFETFAEVFQIALEQQVDMVLLAGDLFHDNRPSRKSLQRCMEVMRDYCLGDRKVDMEVVSDQHRNFHSKCVCCLEPWPPALCLPRGWC